MLKVRLVRSRAVEDDPARRAAARRGRGIFHRDAGAGRHLRVRRRDPAIRGAGRGRGLRLARRTSDDPKVPSYEGGKFPLSTYLAERVREIIADPDAWRALPDQVREWLEIQQWRSRVPGPRELAGRDVSARRQALSRLLSVRGTARAPDARHAADAPARARAAAAARLRRQRICARGVGARRRRAQRSSAASCRSRRCSTRTCWATTSKPGSPNRR